MRRPVPGLRSGLPGTRVARRLLRVFLAAALLPMAAIAIVALDQVSTQLESQSQQRLRRASKAVGMSLIGHLQLAAESLEEVSILVRSSTAPDEIKLFAPVRRRADRFFEEITHVAEDESLTPLLGSSPLVHPADSKPEALDSAVRLVTRLDEEGGPSVEMMVAIDPMRPELGHLVAAFRASSLREMIENGPLPPLGRFCVLEDSAGSAVVCSETLKPPDVSALRIAREASPDTAFRWPVSEEEYLASSWDVFLRGVFGVGSWTVVVAEPMDAVLAPITLFRIVFPALAIVCLGTASLLTIHRLRRLLSPIDDLQQRTRALGEGDFTSRVEVDSDDEFEELANSFNSMAQRLEDQFSSLERMVEIDRGILSHTDVEEIAHRVLTGVSQLYPCDIAVVALTDPDLCKDPESLVVRLDDVDGVVVRVNTTTPPKLDFSPGALDETIELEEANQNDGLDFLRDAGMRLCTLLPIRCSGHIVGAIILARREAGRVEASQIVYARQVADRASVALQNASHLETNRVLAYYDDLTGLPNRLMFKERLEQALMSAERREARVAICLLDLDEFKRINDTLGHNAGDELLKSVGKRLANIARSGSVARLGGDEFTILLTDFDRPDMPAMIARKLLDELSRPFPLNTQQVVISASVGISVYPDDGTDLDTLLMNADSAMYHAKQQGRNGYQFYTQGMNAAAVERLEIENSLRVALERDEFQVYYQPVVDIQTLDIVGAEALVRWQSPERGIVMPSEFIPVAEDTGLIARIGEYVLRTAAWDVAYWQSIGLGELEVAVNLSARQLRDPGSLSSILGAVEWSGIAPERITLELTETMLMDRDGHTMQFLAKLRRLGIRLAIDDFGTGYSSLAYLKHLPVDGLKVDRSFVMDLTRGSSETAITRAIIAMAHSLSLSVVAEGVETEEQLALLREMGCQRAQGYLFGTPAPRDDFQKRLQEER